MTNSNEGAEIINLWESRDYDDDGSGPPETAPGSTESAETDPGAPYGRKPDGTPYKVSQAVRERLAANRSQGSRSRTGRRGTSSARASSSPKAKPTGKPSREPTLLGPLQLLAAGLAAAGAMIPALALDGLAVGMHARPIAEAVDELAAESPRVAAILDRVSQVGPYGVLVVAITPLVLQVAANHRIVPAIPAMGVLDPAELLAANGINPQAAPTQGSGYDQPVTSMGA